MEIFPAVFPRHGKLFSMPWKTLPRFSGIPGHFSTLWKNGKHENGRAAVRGTLRLGASSGHIERRRAAPESKYLGTIPMASLRD